MTTQAESLETLSKFTNAALTRYLRGTCATTKFLQTAPKSSYGFPGRVCNILRAGVARVKDASPRAAQHEPAALLGTGDTQIWQGSGLRFKRPLSLTELQSLFCEMIENMFGAMVDWASPGPGVAGNGFSAKNDSQFKGRD